MCGSRDYVFPHSHVQLTSIGLIMAGMLHEHVARVEHTRHDQTYLVHGASTAILLHFIILGPQYGEAPLLFCSYGNMYQLPITPHGLEGVYGLKALSIT